MPIFKKIQQVKFASIPNATLRDKRLSVEARGVLAYLLTHDDKFELGFPFLQKELNVGRDKLKNILRELKKNGYLCLVAAHNSKGSFDGQEWFVFAESQNADFTVQKYNRVTENPSDVKTVRRENRQPENPSDNKEENLRQKKSLVEKKKESLSPRAGAKSPRTEIPLDEIVELPETPETKFHGAIVRGLKRRLKTPTVLPDEWQWAQAIDWAWKNDFAVKQCLKIFDILEGIRLCKHGEWSISPAFWKRSIPKLEQLKLELKKLKNAPVRAGKNDGNIQKTNGKSYRQERDERAVDDYHIVEQARANADRRRQAKLQGSDAAGG